LKQRAERGVPLSENVGVVALSREIRKNRKLGEGEGVVR